jgi:hypothetical protein
MTTPLFFQVGTKNKSHGVKSGEFGACGKSLTAVFPGPLGQAESNVVGLCCVATVSSSCAKVQDAYN